MITSKATVGSVPRPKGYTTAKRSKFSGKNRASTTLAGFAKGINRVTMRDESTSMTLDKQPSIPAAGMASKLNRTGGGQ